MKMMIRCLTLVLATTVFQSQTTGTGFVAAAESTEEECVTSVDSEGTCQDPDGNDDNNETSKGLNALPIRKAVVSGELSARLCGPWCQEESTPPTEACEMDSAIMPCEGEFFCTTTCALWTLMTNPSERPSVSCDMFTRFDGFPIGAEPCDERCLLPEIRKERYPQPTGLGLLCEPGSCDASSSSMAQLSSVVGILQCPCNWFGSDCPDDMVPIVAISETASYGDGITAVTLFVSPSDWKKIMANHQPGGVVRVTHRDPSNPDKETARMREQPYALAYAPREGELEVLTAPPNKSLLPAPREVAERIRGLSNGTIEGGNLFVNPSVGGFNNEQYTPLMDVLLNTDQETGNIVSHLVVLSTGAGLSGALSAVEAALAHDFDSVHLYYGLRHVEDLPYRKKLDNLVMSGRLNFTLIESRAPSSDSGEPSEEGIGAALRRGTAVRQLEAGPSLAPHLPEGQKVYVQHALGLDLTSSGGALFSDRIVLKNTAFVACGCMAVLEESSKILKAVFCPSESEDDGEECHELLGQRYFTNI